MKRLIILLPCLIACNQPVTQSGNFPPSSNSQGTSSPTIVIEPEQSPAPDVTPEPTPTDSVPTPSPSVTTVAPTPTPTLVASPTPTPTFTPGFLYCYENGIHYVYCTNGNLGVDTRLFDLYGVFTGNNPQVLIDTVTIAHNQDANATAVCAQPSSTGCVPHSECVTVQMHVRGFTTSYTATSCGDEFRVSTNSLQ